MAGKNEDSSEHQPFLNQYDQTLDHIHDQKAGEDATTLQSGSYKPLLHQINYNHLLWHGLVIILYSIVFYSMSSTWKSCDGTGAVIYCTGSPAFRTYSSSGKVLIFTAPAKNVIEYQTKLLDGFLSDSVFVGDPTPQVDAAWHGLLASMRLVSRTSFTLSLRMQTSTFVLVPTSCGH